MAKHIHADLMKLYAEDAAKSKTPWEFWQCRSSSVVWQDMTGESRWFTHIQYRRKPEPIPTRVINGFTVPAPITEFSEVDETYFCADPAWGEFVTYSRGHRISDLFKLARGLLFTNPEHAVANAKAMCNIDPEWSQE